MQFGALSRTLLLALICIVCLHQSAQANAVKKSNLREANANQMAAFVETSEAVTVAEGEDEEEAAPAEGEEEAAEGEEAAEEGEEAAEGEEGAEGEGEEAAEEGEEGAEGEEAAEEEGLPKVMPRVEKGFKMEPAPGMSDPAVTLTPLDDLVNDVGFVTQAIGTHTFKSDVGTLLGEIDNTENQIKSMKLRIVEKENFIDSLIKREDILQADLNTDKGTVGALQAHIKSLKARIEKTKKMHQLRLLEAQFHEYAAAAAQLKAQSDDLYSVKNALFSKMHFLNDVLTPLTQVEEQQMRVALGAEAADDQLKPQDMFPTTPPSTAPTPPTYVPTGGF